MSNDEYYETNSQFDPGMLLLLTFYHGNHKNEERRKKGPKVTEGSNWSLS